MTGAKNAVVTGGGSGIGAAVAERLRGEGYNVATIDLNPPADDPLAEAADVTDLEQLAAAFAAIREQLGPITILVNAAGLDGFRKFSDIDFASWSKVIDVNLNGVYHPCRRCYPTWSRPAGAGSSTSRRRARIRVSRSWRTTWRPNRRSTD